MADARRQPGQRSWRDIGIQVLKTSAAMAVVLGASALAARLGILPNVESVALDAQMRFNRPREGSQVALVTIDDDDYRTLFNARSPLDREQLRNILAAIARERPSVIGVDLDTSDPAYAGFEVPADWPTVVWGRVGRAQAEGKLRLSGVLGGREPPACSGVVAMRLDDDGVARHYRREFLEKDLCDPATCRAGAGRDDAAARAEKLCEVTSCPLPAFPWAVLQAHSAVSKEFTREDFRKLKDATRDGGELAVRFAGPAEQTQTPAGDCADAHAPAESQSRTLKAGQRIQLTAGEILHNAEAASAQPRPDEFRPLEGKIVLLGGTYSSYFRDEHRTPLGVMPGVELLAQVVETELEGGGLPEPNLLAVGLLLLFDNILLAVVFKHFHDRPVRTLALSAVVILAFAVLCSLAAFRTPRLWVYFIPVLLVALILELYDHAKDYRDALVRKLSGEEGAHAPLFAVEGRHEGTLRDFAAERLADIKRTLTERGHKSITDTWEELRATLSPAGLRIECRSELKGKEVRRSFYFYEAEGGEKILIESTDAEA
ncbi:MAG: CHASE2 domain-containing protein [Pyrinomonadaceae bacterium]